MSSPRKIEQRHKGSAHSFIRRMVSPGDVGERIKPFVFLDYVSGHVAPGSGFGFHPHSGIATLTYPLSADVQYEDTTGQKGIVSATGLEWMRAGGGTWHQGFIHPKLDTMEAFQLWIALPPIVEEGPAEGLYIEPAQVPQVGNVRVLLGEYGGAINPIPAPSPMTYLDVVLGPDESWTYQPPAGHTIAWAMVYRGTALANGEAVTQELVVFEDGEGPLTFATLAGARVLFGSAQKHEHPLVLGSHSVHTSEAALAKGMAGIRAVARQLKQAGRL